MYQTMKSNLSQMKTDTGIALMDEGSSFQEGDTAYSVDIGFYKVAKEDIEHANKNHFKVIAILDEAINDIRLTDEL